MANYTEKAKTGIFPVVPLRDVVAFPNILFHLEISEPKDLASVENAMQNESLVFLIALKNSENENPLSAKDFASTGVVGKITSRKGSGKGK